MIRTCLADLLKLLNILVIFPFVHGTTTPAEAQGCGRGTVEEKPMEEWEGTVSPFLSMCSAWDEHVDVYGVVFTS